VASTGWLLARWLPQTGFPGFRKRIQHGEVAKRQAFDNESLFLKIVRQVDPKWIELNRYRGIWIHVRICALVWQAGGSCNHFRQELSNDPDEPSLPSDD
jgi:hypothetical protein